MLPIPGVSKLEFYGIVAGIILLLAGIAYGYYEWSSTKIDALTAQVTIEKTRGDMLDATVAAMKSDMGNIKAVTDKLNESVNVARQQAAIASRNIRSQDLNAAAKVDSKALTKQINTDLSNSFKALEDASHAQ